ncbi:MAG TPA: chromosomal replication initiator protein DnaA [Candidatus Binatia bacterium]
MRSWQHAQETLRESLGEGNFATWIKPLRMTVLEDGRASFEVPSKFFRDWVEQRYLDALRAALADETNPNPEVVFKINGGAQGELFASDGEPRKPTKRRERPTNAARIANLVPRYTFENFVVGPSNQLAYAAARAIANNPGEVYNPVFIYGATGVGKTHLVNAIGHFVLDKDPAAKVVYLSSEAFVNEMIAALRHHRMDEFKKRFRKVDVLIVDDVQFLAGRERTQEEFFHTFNTLYEAGRQIVLSSDRPPSEIPKLEERLRSRFAWGLLADIQPPDFETRLAILRKRCEADGLEMPDDVLRYVAEVIRSNIRVLEGALRKVATASRLAGTPPTLDLAIEALRDLAESQHRAVTIDRIQSVVSEHFGLTPAQLKGKSRARELALARQIAMFLCRELTQASLPHIGEQFGGRDHSTVLHAVDKVQSLARRDPAIADLLRHLRQRLTRP